MKVLVCGGRYYKDREHVEWVLAKMGATVIVEPGTLGAPYLAAEWARRKGLEVKTFRMDPMKYGLQAGVIRTRRMIEEGPDLVVVFPGDDIIADVLGPAREAGIEILQAETLSAATPTPEESPPDESPSEAGASQESPSRESPSEGSASQESPQADAAEESLIPETGDAAGNPAGARDEDRPESVQQDEPADQGGRRQHAENE